MMPLESSLLQSNQLPANRVWISQQNVGSPLPPPPVALQRCPLPPPPASTSRHHLTEKSLLHCIVMANPYCDRHIYMNFEDDGASKKLDGAFSKVKSGVRRERVKSDDDFAVPLRFLQCSAEKELTPASGFDNNGGKDQTFAWPAADAAEPSDFTEQLCSDRPPPKDILHMILTRLQGDGITLYPEGMFVDGVAHPERFWTSPDEDELYILMHVSLEKIQNTAEHFGSMFQTNPFSSYGGASAVYTRKLDAALSRSVLANKDQFEAQVSGLTPVPGMFTPWGIRFFAPQRMRIIDRILKDRFIGCGLEMDELKRRNIMISQYFPVQNNVLRASLLEWASLRALIPPFISRINDILSQPLGAIIQYHGEKVGLYFFWLESYTKCLTPIAAYGVLVSLIGYGYGERNTWHTSLGIATVIWGMVWVLHWKRREARFSEEHGTTVEAVQEQVRDDFVGPTRRLNMFELYHHNFGYPLTIETGHRGALFERTNDNWVRIMKRAVIIYPFTWLVVLVLIGILVYITDWRFDAEDVPQDVRTYAASTMTIVVMTIFGWIFQFLVGMLNEFENNRTDTEHENSLILKSFLFAFCNAYSALFIIALWPLGIQEEALSSGISKFCTQSQRDFFTYTANSTSMGACHCVLGVAHLYKTVATFRQKRQISSTSCFDVVSDLTQEYRVGQLASQLLFILVFRPFIQNIQELIQPFINAALRRWYDESGGTPHSFMIWLLTCGCFKGRGLKLGGRKMYMDHTEPFWTTTYMVNGQPMTLKQIKTRNKGKSINLLDDTQTDIDRRVILWVESQREPYESTATDFLEICIQMGYMTMFGVVFTWAPFACLFYNCLEIRIDAIKLVYFVQRNRMHTAGNIGSWSTIFAFLVMCSVVTTSYVTCFLDDIAPRWYVTFNGAGTSVTTCDRMVVFIGFIACFGFIAAVLTAFIDVVPNDVKKSKTKHALLQGRRIALKEAKRWNGLKTPHPTRLMEQNGSNTSTKGSMTTSAGRVPPAENLESLPPTPAGPRFVIQSVPIVDFNAPVVHPKYRSDFDLLESELDALESEQEAVLAMAIVSQIPMPPCPRDTRVRMHWCDVL